MHEGNSSHTALLSMWATSALELRHQPLNPQSQWSNISKTKMLLEKSTLKLCYYFVVVTGRSFMLLQMSIGAEGNGTGRATKRSLHVVDVHVQSQLGRL